MSKPEKDSKVTRRQSAEMRKWREEFGQSVRQVTVLNKSTKDNPGTLPINCYFTKPSEPQPVDFDNLLSMPSASDEEDLVAPSSSNLFGKDAFVVINPGYQPSRLSEAPFFLGKCKNNVKASERKLTVSIYAQDQLLPFNFVDAQLQCQIEISGILRKAEPENVRIEDDVVALDEDEYSSCVIDCLDYGDQTTARELAEIEDVSEEAEASNKVVQVRPSETTVQTTRSGRTPRPRNQSLYLFYD